MLVLYEDDDLLVIHKPSGINTHKPDRFTQDGIHEWLAKREPRWRTLAILQRLDKGTSGVMVFGKTTRANQSLAKQFEAHTVEKTYLLLSTVRPTRKKFWAKTPNTVTEFEFIGEHGVYFLTQARPLTGKTHQIRRHAAESGFPILGDTEYEGEPAPRLMLHAYKLAFLHPASGERVVFEASVPRAFDEVEPVVVAGETRELFFDENTNAYRLLTEDDVIVDWYDGHALVQWQTEKRRPDLCGKLPARTVHEQIVTKQRRTLPVGPLLERFPILENGVTFLVNFGEGLATGIFLDQRENRRRLRTMALKGKSVLNTFAYTCAFSVAAAKAGAVTTSVDLSKNYLEWGKDNFRANGLDPAPHEFIFGDTFEWLKRLAKRGRPWDVVILDPPTFSTTKKGRVFQAARDYEELATLAMPLVAPGGWLLCSTNQRTLGPEEFEKSIQDAARGCDRFIQALEFETLPWDFRVAPKEKPYLKTFWAKLA